MAAKKTRKINKKAPKSRVSRGKSARTTKSRMVSFFIGVVTVTAIAFLIYNYAQTNNYKTVLGTNTQNQRLK